MPPTGGSSKKLVYRVGVNHRTAEPHFFSDEFGGSEWSLTNPGEKRLYSTNSTGDQVVASIILKADGTIRADNEVTKAEAAVLINNFIDHLKDNITSDYREKVMSRY